MDIERVNYVLEKAILGFQAGELETLWEKYYTPPTPAEMHKRTGMALPKKDKPKKVKSPKNDPVPASVDFWCTYLSHKLTRQDMAETKREAKRGIANIYRLGHLMGALEKVRADVKSLLQNDDDVSLEKFRASMNRRFVSTYPPIKAVGKALDKYKKTGKRPKIGK